MAEKSFNAYLKNSELPVLVDFWAEWCSPCRVLSPIIEEFAKKYRNQINVIKVNVDKRPQIANNYSIRSIPTMILFKNAEPVWRESGLMSFKDLESRLLNYL